MQEHGRYETGSFPGRCKPKMTEQEAKIATLKKELAGVKEERDILKKAVRIFSKGDSRNTNS